MSEDPKPIRIVLLYGGQSAEHHVSRISASSVLKAIDTDRYEVLPVAIAADGRWMLSEDTLAAIGSGTDALPEELGIDGPVQAPTAILAREHQDQHVVVLPILHGPRGEDGTVQGLLELADVAYVGTGVLGSALNMDKATAKVVAQAAGIPVCRWISARDTEIDDVLIARVGAELGWPVFVKPSNMGSSVGVSKASDPAELRTALDTAAKYDEWVVIEEAVTARELEVGVIGNASPRASVVGEIIPTHDFYDYEDKYVDGKSQMVIPADVPDEVAEEMRRLALRAYAALRCDGLSRVDFFYEEGGRGLLFNEINTMPGFTKYSMFPSLWEASGLEYGKLIDELIRVAIARHTHRHKTRRLV